MPQLEEMYQNLKAENINLIGVGTDSGESEENLETSRKILTEKGVTFQNIFPTRRKHFIRISISEILGYPTTYVVDKEGNIIGAPIIGNLENQMDVLQKRIDTILSEK